MFGRGRFGKRPSLVCTVAQTIIRFRILRSLMRGQNLGETPDVVEGIVKRGRGGPDDVRLPEIGFDAGGFEFLVNLFRILVRQERKLAAARFTLTRRDDGEAI